ncbi:Hypothetical protein NTJ_00898 [Nesidiocoris tenuis]|uniref:Uncharacterized protein n=1 Tax=Nesidiocoris tenuis TaxID=355587 RepID=A0ABN7A744_9HEMI|nr:Hypothetical protein NTJ_00898 [Nesidiocoris tenuis]
MYFLYLTALLAFSACVNPAGPSREIRALPTARTPALLPGGPRGAAAGPRGDFRFPPVACRPPLRASDKSSAVDFCAGASARSASCRLSHCARPTRNQLDYSLPNPPNLLRM